MKVPKLCKDCPYAYHFKDGENCWYYWKGKEHCAKREWEEKEV